jgi:plasmid rolling circle replication initiator protein Rep
MTDSSLETGDIIYLTEISPQDKPWDKHRTESDQVRDLYSGTLCDRLGDRIASCSGLLGFGWLSDPETGETRLKLQTARFCRVRHCPVCQWRKSMMWSARFLKATPAILKDHPKARFIFLTLTVRNCSIEDLRSTVQEMNKAFHRLIKRKEFPAIGFAKSLEITRGKDGSAHPHFHVLMMVQPKYFDGKNYLSQNRWTDLWKDVLRVDYTPVVNVKAVKPNKNRPESEALPSAICETFKYSVKPEDLVSDRAWLVELTTQLHKTRAINLGGVFKQYLSEEEPEDLIGDSDEDEPCSDVVITFGWREYLKRYCKVEY